jgi:hypothetical protein
LEQEVKKTKRDSLYSRFFFLDILKFWGIGSTIFTLQI